MESHDTIIFTTRKAADITAELIAQLLTRWPSALVALADNIQIESSLDRLHEILDLRRAGDDIGLVFLQDAKMRRHFHAHGYTLMKSGEGPCAVFTRARARVRLKVSRVVEVQALDQEGEGNRVAPYPAWVCSPRIVEIAVGTPEDPRSDPFSRWLVDTATQICCRSRR